MMANPAINRTCAMKPAQAGYLERYVSPPLPRIAFCLGPKFGFFTPFVVRQVIKRFEHKPVVFRLLQVDHSGSFARLILSLSHSDPPSFKSFSHSASVMRMARGFMTSPLFASGLRPWPLPGPPCCFASTILANRQPSEPGEMFATHGHSSS
jgi:hypothetical protein